MSQRYTRDQPSLTRLTRELVSALVPELKDDRIASDQLVRQKIRELRNDSIGGTRREWENVRSTLDGLSHTAKVRVQDDLAEALDKNVRLLEGYRAKGIRDFEGDLDITMGNLPQHVHLLLNLATPPSIRTHDYAYAYLNRTVSLGPTADQILYEKIMAEEPYDPGEVFDEEVKHGWTDSDSGFNSDLDSASTEEVENSPAEDEVRTPSSAVVRAERRRLAQQRKEQQAQYRLDEALEAMRKHLDGKYWHHGGQEVGEMDDAIYGWKAMTTVTASAAIARSLLGDSPTPNKKVLSARQLQRELLFALSGRPGILFHFSPAGSCMIAQDHPEVQHLSPGALQDVLQTFQNWSTLAAHIRSFVIKTLQPDEAASTSSSLIGRLSRPLLAHHGTNKTQQAFAEACRCEMEKFDSWLAELEASFISGRQNNSCSISGVSAATTPLLLQREVNQRSSILSHLASLIPHSASPTVLIDLVYSTLTSLRQTTTADSSNLSSLMEIFLETVKPTWSLLGQWIQRGMPVPSALTDNEGFTAFGQEIEDERSFDPEFFLRRDRDVSWADEDFWENGWIIGEEGWPDWLGDEMGQLALEAGKARGLLRSLLENVGVVEEWKELRDLLQSSSAAITPQVSAEHIGEHLHLPPDIDVNVDIAEIVAAYLIPTCQVIQFHLRRVLDDECGLEQHLEAIDGLMYMRGFDVMHEWKEWLFVKILSNERWSDFQVLTSTLRDVIERREAGWMNPTAIRIRTVKQKEKETLSGPRALSALRADYQVPFPLSQLFTSTSMELRSEVFAFLMQLQMGRYLLNQTKTMDNQFLAQCVLGEKDVTSMLALRHQLIWFLDTIWTWITERIISLRTADFRTKLSEMTSLRAMINLELAHARRIRDFCFLHPKDEDTLNSILSVLDMSQVIFECFTTYLAEMSVRPRTPTHLRSDNITRRRPKPKRRGTPHIELSDDSDDDEKQGGKEREITINTSISFADLSLGQRVEKIARDLENVVQIVRKNVEQLINDAGEERDGWEMLAFALAEWK